MRTFRATFRHDARKRSLPYVISAIVVHAGAMAVLTLSYGGTWTNHLLSVLAIVNVGVLIQLFKPTRTSTQETR
ncbi:hypothetical protein DSY14_13935 [Nocardiopsis sp. MG754419]|nr:hypothetical protein [Nocardiopsis sp. MG754419]